MLARAEAAERADTMAGREVRRDRYTVSDCMTRIARRLRRGSFTFSELFEDHLIRSEFITMFMALLEMARLNRVHIIQDAPYADIMITNAQ